MGRGDIKTKRGKISSGTFGVVRPHKKKKDLVVAAKPKAKKPAAKKTATTKKEKSHKEKAK